MAWQRHGVSEREPVEVGFRGHAVDLGGIQLRPWPWAERDGRADQHVVIFEEALIGAVDPRLRRRSASVVFERVAEAFLDIGADIGAEHLGPFPIVLAVHGKEQAGAQHGEGIVCTGAVGRRLAAFGEQRREPFHAISEDAADGSFGRRKAEVLGEGETELAERRGAGRGPPFGAFAQRLARQCVGERIAGIVARHHRQHQCGIDDVARHRSIGRQVGPTEGAFLARHKPVGGAHADNAGIARGVAQRSAGVGARGKRSHAASERGRRAAGGAGRRPHGIEGIAGRAEDGIAGVAAGGPFRRIGLAEDDGAGRAQPCDRTLIGGGHIVTQQGAAIGGAHPGGVLRILDQDGESVQRAVILSAQDRGLGLLCGGAGSGLVERHDGVDGGIDRGGARQAGIEQLDRRDRPCGQQAAQLNGIGVTKLGQRQSFPIVKTI